MILSNSLHKKLKLLIEKPIISDVDHILILHELYFEYSQRETKEIQPIIDYFLGNSFDNLPCLKEKHLWNEEKYNLQVQPFFDSHNKLVEIIKEILNK